jgi:hypothetical protein
MHARELMNPDAIVELQVALVVAYLDETGITIGSRTWTAADIKVILEALDIWMLPCANPDGREYVMTVDDLWRKNRGDNPGTPCDGVDVNRNCDIMWGIITTNTSCNPCTSTFCGPDRFSEPESRNIRDLCDMHRIDVFLDVHSFSELVLFPWGHAQTQTTDASQLFTSLATGTCAPLSPATHQEYMLPRDQLRFQRVSRQIVADIQAVRGRVYTAQPGRDLYATSGVSSDYTYSRHIANPALRKTYGFAFETGPFVGDDRLSFHPDDPTSIKKDAKAGMISLLQQSICAIEFIGGTLLGTGMEMRSIRKVRDQRLLTTDAGRDLIALFERVQIPLLGLILADKELTKEAMSLLELAGQLLESDKATVSARDVKRGLALVDALANRTTSAKIRRDLDVVRKQLQKASDKSVRKVLDGLLKGGGVAKSRKAAAARKQPTTKRSSKSTRAPAKRKSKKLKR